MTRTLRGFQSAAELRTFRLMAELQERMISERIAKARKRRGWTQDDLARELNTTGKTISNYENNRVPWKRLEEIAGVLGVSHEWLLTGEEERGVPEASAILQAIADLRRDILAEFQRLGSCDQHAL